MNAVMLLYHFFMIDTKYSHFRIDIDFCSAQSAVRYNSKLVEVKTGGGGGEYIDTSSSYIAKSICPVVRAYTRTVYPTSVMGPDVSAIVLVTIILHRIIACTMGTTAHDLLTQILPKLQRYFIQ